MAQFPDSELGWAALVDRLPATLDLAASAREARAFVRARGVGSAECLLRLALIYGTTPLSLRGTAAWAEATGLAQISDVALLGRLQAADAWLNSVVAALLTAAVVPPDGIARRLRLVDATTIPAPGRGDRSWRLHADFDLAASRFVGLQLTDHHGNESFERFTPEPGDLVIADRFYAKPRQVHHVRDCGADFLVRWGLTGCRLTHLDGRRFDLAQVLGECDGAQDIPVLVAVPAGSDRQPTPARLLMRHLGPQAAERGRRRARKQAGKHRQTPTTKRLKAAEYCLLLTSLEDVSADQVFAAYRLRWQIELAFKRLKSLAGLEDLQAKEPRLARSCLYAKIIFALLSEDLLREIRDSFPSDQTSTTAVDLAATAHSTDHLALPALGRTPTHCDHRPSQ